MSRWIGLVRKARPKVLRTGDRRLILGKLKEQELMEAERNSQVRLAARPEGMPTRQHWEMSQVPVARPSRGQVLVKTAFVSIDPAMRGWLRDAKSYLPPVAIGEVMRAGGVGTVVASEHPGFTEGDQVVGHVGVQSHALVQGEALRKVSSLLVNRARMQGFIVSDYSDQYEAAVGEMAAWLAEGKLRYRETIVQGLETFPETFQRLFTGEKIGKLLIQV